MNNSRPPYFPERVHPTNPVEQFVEVLGERVFVRMIVLRAKEENGVIMGDIVPQHVHADAHYTMLIKGRVRAWIDDKLMGDFYAPHAIYIEARKQHTFQALVDDTVIVCNHITDGKGEPKILKFPSN